MVKQALKSLCFVIREYSLYRIKSKDEYSLHSPLIFELYTCCIAKDKRNIRDKITDFFAKDCPIEKLESTNYDPEKLLKEIATKDDIVIIVEKIHQTRQAKEKWQKVLSDDRTVRVTIDFFSCGVIIRNKRFRQKQDYILKQK